MRRNRTETRDPGAAATATLPEVGPGFMDAVDPDPLVEEMVQRLRTGLSGMVALDEWGRPVAWRNVVRLALGPTLSRLRDAEADLAMLRELAQRSEEETAGEPQEPADAHRRENPTAQHLHRVIDLTHGVANPRVDTRSALGERSLSGSPAAHDRES